MSFNVRNGRSPDGENHWDHRASLLFDTIRASRADVVALQEDADFQLAQIVEAVPEYAAIGGGSDGATGGEHVAILYRMERLELGDRGVFWLSERPDEPGSRGFGASYPRLCTWAVLRDRRNGLELVVYNTHLDHRAGDARARGLRLIAAHIREHAGSRPVLVTGDLNLGPEDTALTEFLADARMIDTYRAAHPATSADEGTYHHFRGDLDGPRIDFVLASEGARVRAADIVRVRSDDGRYPSDHYPITATVHLQRSGVAEDGSRDSSSAPSRR